MMKPISNTGVCWLTCAEMTPLRMYFLPEVNDDPMLPPLQEGDAPRNPFDSLLVSTARRTADGFEFRLMTR